MVMLTVHMNEPLSPVHTERHNVTLMSGTFDLFDGYLSPGSGGTPARAVGGGGVTPVLALEVLRSCHDQGTPSNALAGRYQRTGATPTWDWGTTPDWDSRTSQKGPGSSYWGTVHERAWDQWKYYGMEMVWADKQAKTWPSPFFGRGR